MAYGADARAGAFGIFDSATVFGTSSTAGATGFGSGACVIGPNADAEALGGVGPFNFFNFASILNTGSTFDQALAGDTAGAFLSPANFDIASIVGTDSTALAGSDLTTAGSFDLAGAFGDMLHAMTTGGNFLVDILP